MKKAICLLFLLPFLMYGCQSCDTSVAPETTHTAPSQTQEPVWQKYLEYESAAGEIVIKYIASPNATLVLPAYIEGQPVTRLGEMVCYQNSTCHTITLPETLKTIDSSAFYRCSSLQEIRIPQNVSAIGESAFFRCSSLMNIWVETGNSNFCDIDGVLFTKDGKTMLAYPEGRETIQYALPDGVTAIAADAFGYHPSLQYIIIPDSVTHFPEGNLFVYPEEITIIASADSAAAAYAAKFGIAFSDVLPNQ